MPYNVLHLLGSAQRVGSYARNVAALASGLDQHRYRIHAWFTGADGPAVEALEAAGAQVRVVPWGGRRDPAGTWQIWNALRSVDWAIIHLHGAGPTIRGLARTASRAKIIVHLHAPEVEEEGAHPVRRYVWDADVVIANTRAVAQLAVGTRPYVVYPGAVIPDHVRRGGLSRDRRGRVIGTMRRLVPVKGVVYLIRAMALLHTHFPDVCLDIAGTGPEQTRLESEVHSLGLSDHVAFLGWRTDIADLLAKWEIFVMPSLQEGFGIAALDAMAAGLPVVATAVGGVPELVQNGLTGWLVPPGDSETLARKLGMLLLNPEQRMAMGAAGRDRARKHFSVDHHVAGIAKIYDNILGLGPL